MSTPCPHSSEASLLELHLSGWKCFDAFGCSGLGLGSVGLGMCRTNTPGVLVLSLAGSGPSHRLQGGLRRGLQGKMQD